MRLGKLPLILFAGALLAGCNSTESALDVGAAKPVAAVSPDIAAAKAPASPAAQSAALSATRMQFAPMIGAPVEQVTALSRRLTLQAKEKNLTIFPAAEKNVTHVLKGYFSLLNEGGKLTVLYVFDVIDPSGNRLHRINGQRIGRRCGRKRFMGKGSQPADGADRRPHHRRIRPLARQQPRLTAQVPLESANHRRRASLNLFA